MRLVTTLEFIIILHSHWFSFSIVCGAKVMFEIELITFIDYKAASDYSQLTREDRRQMTVQDLIAVANAERAVSPADSCCDDVLSCREHLRHLFLPPVTCWSLP